MKKIAAATLFATLSIPVLSAELVSIGTGGVSGVYYPTGGFICSLVNKSKKEHGVRCSVEATGGSVYNINSIRAGELEMGIAQSDWQYHAYNGTVKFKKKGAFKKLRAVFSLNPEAFTVVARRDSGIQKFNDLKGKRVNIGNPGSGQRGTMEVLMKEKGWDKKSFKLATELTSIEQAKALCDNKIDAIVFTVGHPSGSIQEATSTCDSILIDVQGEEVANLVSNNSYYRSATIPAGLYRGNDVDIKTFGVGATFVSSSDISEEIIYNVVKSVFENFEHFKRYHPSFQHLKKSEMIVDGLSAPLHKGAIKYYKEVGLL